MLQIPELLAPAGDLERLRYAINYGADAVYCSLPEFGMRSAPANFTPEQLTEGVIYAHARGRKVYLTMNTLPTNAEADRLPDAIKEAAKAGVDAFIVADLGVLDACKTFAVGKVLACGLLGCLTTLTSGLSTTATSEEIPDSTTGGFRCCAQGSTGNHKFSEHTTACAPDIHAQAGHEAVDLLRDLQECERTQEPDEYISGDNFSTAGVDCCLHIALLDCKCCGGEHLGQCSPNPQQHDSPILHCELLSHQTESGLARNVPTILTNSLRHHAFIIRRKSCPPSILHHALKMLEVFSDAPVANAIGAV